MAKNLITTEKAREIATSLGIDFAKVKFTPDDLRKGMLVELEHGTANPLTNITNDDLVMTAKIALAHLMEHDDSGEPMTDYYDQLKYVEQSAVIRVIREKAYVVDLTLIIIVIIILFFMCMIKKEMKEDFTYMPVGGCAPHDPHF